MKRLPQSPGFMSRFGRDMAGVAAVEFAMIAPVLILIYFGLTEFCQAYMAQRRMAYATAQVADIVAQSQAITGNDVDDILAIGGLILAPFPESPLTLRVSSITRGSDGVARVVWSRGKGMTRRSGVVAVPAGLIDNGESIIMSEGTYRFSSTLGQVLPGMRDFDRTYWLRPRLVNDITCTNC